MYKQQKEYKARIKLLPVLKKLVFHDMTITEAIEEIIIIIKDIYG